MLGLRSTLAFVLVVATATAGGGRPSPDLLVPGSPLEGELRDGAPVVHTPTLDEKYPIAPTRGLEFVVRPTHGGIYTIELRSFEFDPYLVLREDSGELLAEDDDGSHSVHARLVVELEAGTEYSLHACALHGLRGAFVLTLERGAPPELTEGQRIELELERLHVNAKHAVRIFGEAHKTTGFHWNLLAFARYRSGDLAGAAQAERRALSSWEGSLGEEHDWTTKAMETLAVMLDEAGQLRDVLELRERLVEVRARHSGPDDLATAAERFQLGRLLLRLGRGREAVGALTRCLTTRIDRLGPAHPEAILTRSDLGRALTATGQYGQAVEQLQLALELEQSRPDSAPADAATVAANLATALESTERYEEARILLEDARITLEQHLGPGHATTAAVWNNLAMIYGELERYEEARELLQHALRVRREALGPDALEVAETLNNYGQLLHSVGEAGAAREALEQALRLFKVHLGNEHPDTATCRQNLGRTLHELQEFRLALEHLDQSLVVGEAFLGVDHPDLAVTLCALGDAQFSVGEFAAAEESLLRARALRDRHWGPRHRFSIDVRVQLALLDADRHRIEAALENLEFAISALEPDGGRSGAASGMATGGELGSRADRLASLGRRALELDSTVSRARADRISSVLDALARTCMQSSENRLARPLLDRALVLDTERLGPAHPLLCSRLGNLATIAASEGDYVRARELLERAVAISEEALGSAHRTTSDLRGNLGWLLLNQGDTEGALQLHGSVLSARKALYGPEHPDVAESLVNLAECHRALEDFDRTEELLSRALGILEATVGEDSPEAATTQVNLSTLYAELGRTELAELHARKAHESFRRRIGTDHPSTAISSIFLAQLEAERGDSQSALSRLRDAHRVMREQLGPRNPDTVTVLGNLAAVLVDLGDCREAWRLLGIGLDDLNAHVRAILAARTRREGLLLVAIKRSALFHLLSVADCLGTDEAYDEAFRALVEWKGQVERAARAVRRPEAASARAEDLAGRLQQLHAELGALAYRWQGSAEARGRKIAETREEVARLEVELRRSVGAAGTESPSTSTLREALPRGSVVIAFLEVTRYEPARRDSGGRFVPGRESEPHMVAYVLGRGAPAVGIDLGPSAPLRELAHGSIERASSTDRGVGVIGSASLPLRALRRALWDPLEPHLGGARHVILSTDSFLGALPFGVLQREDGRYLLEDHAFVYQHDLTRLVDLGSEPPRVRGALLAVGGVAYDDRGPLVAEASVTTLRNDTLSLDLPRWGPLPGTAAEVEAICALHSSLLSDEGRVVMSGSEATEERVVEELPRASFVHFATHGYFRPEGISSQWDFARQISGPSTSRLSGSGGRAEWEALVGTHPALLSGLVFAGANSESVSGRADGYLTAADVEWLDLSDVELVTLSACNTGLGRSQSGEGMSGFQTTLHTAGARAVVASLWKVPDAPTRDLMRRFYENLWRNGMGKLESLREAQLWMLERNREAGRPDGVPGSWGAFVLSGDWR